MRWWRAICAGFHYTTLSLVVVICLVSFMAYMDSLGGALPRLVVFY